jgi:hypothetical protein
MIAPGQNVILAQPHSWQPTTSTTRDLISIPSPLSFFSLPHRFLRIAQDATADRIVQTAAANRTSSMTHATSRSG